MVLSKKALKVEDAWLPLSNRERRWAIKSLIRGTNRHLCICETLRLIYDEIVDMKDKKKRETITKRLADAFMMGKKLTDRLRYYKNKYKDTTGKGGKGLIYILDTKKRRNMRWKRKL